jgi:hypothetical protein
MKNTKHSKYVSGADRAERFDGNLRNVGCDPTGLAASVRESRRGHIHLLVRRAHSLRLPGARPRQQTWRIQQTRIPGTPIQSYSSRKQRSLKSSLSYKYIKYVVI